MRSARSGILSLISSALWWVICSAAPLMEFSGDPGFQQFLRKNEEFALKINSDVVAMKDRMREEFKLGNDSELQLLREILAIQQVTLNCHSSLCNVEDCFNQIWTGLQTYKSYLIRVAEVLPSYANQVTSLQLDVSNLSANIQQQMEESGLPTVSYPQAETKVLPNLESQKQIGSYIILNYFKGFLEMTIRALRHCGA
ncbi:granulocyte colony-stimulating factor [Tiliqua scincoides]|uniref:granulocyte colony-stimulating factor n=1 Tax=Tiliqua scincoides TaxID=71010 RepID=UPI00346333BA